MSDRDERPLRASLDLDAWEPQAPPPDFAERVLGRIQADKPAATPAAAAGVNEKEKRSRFTRVAAGTLATLALAAGVLLAVDRAPAKGDAIAKDRTEVDIGSRARAVLEPGAHVAWNGDDVTQDTGDVFYRVEPGAKFRVHTPAGDVEVKGTCFTVKVHGDDMNKRDAKSAAVGAAVTALAFVAVYEGKVAVSQAATHVDVAAGESATLGPDGAVKSGDIASGEGSFRDRVESDPTNAANQNLVGQVQEYRHRLELLAAQKTEVEKKLEATEKKLAATTDGSVRTRNEYDLDQDDWRELAKKGEVKYRSPCLRTDRFDFPADKLQKLGLAPQDGAVLKDAYQKSYQRVWSTVRPLCIAALGTSEQIVDRIGP